MNNVFIKEVIDGELIEVSQITVRHIIAISVMPMDKPENKMINLLLALVKVNDNPLTEQTLLDWTNIKGYTFCQEAINRMIEGLNI